MDQKLYAGVSWRDIWFAFINSAIFGAFLPLIVKSFGVALPSYWQLDIIGIIFLAIFGVILGRFFSRYLSFTFQLSKFAVVGASNTAIDVGVLQLLILFSGGAVGYIATGFKIISFMFAVTNSYIWNKFWSFEQKTEKNAHKEFSQFLIISLIGLILNAFVFTIMTQYVGVLGPFDEKGWATISAIAGTFVVLAWNFVGYKYIVFKK